MSNERRMREWNRTCQHKIFSLLHRRPKSVICTKKWWSLFQLHWFRTLIGDRCNFQEIQCLSWLTTTNHKSSLIFRLERYVDVIHSFWNLECEPIYSSLRHRTKVIFLKQEKLILFHPLVIDTIHESFSYCQLFLDPDHMCKEYTHNKLPFCHTTNQSSFWAVES